MATIYDVAHAANVSPKTVSRVLNGDAPVSKETRQAVEQAIAALGYVPSTAARAMRSNRSGLVGLITGALTQAPQSTEMAGLPELFIVQGIQRRIEDSRMTLVISDTGGHSDRVPGLIRTFAEHRVEGLFYIAEYHQKVALPALPAAAKLILVNCFDDRGTPAILPDDRGGQHALVRELIALGHRRIAYLTLTPALMATGLRSEGYRQALAEAGIEYDPALVVPGEEVAGEDNAAFMDAQVAALLRLDRPPTVICCGNDRMAMRLYGILRSRGLDIPRDISVAGYDDYRLIAETLYPPLTTAVLPYHAMGTQAAERMLAWIDGTGEPDPHDPVLVPSAAVRRASVTPATPR